MDPVSKDNTKEEIHFIGHHQERGFRKNYYSSWKSFWGDFQYLISRRNRIKNAMRSDVVDPAFRERLMLTVTEVNRCRYCRAFHVQQAYQVGLSDSEVLTFIQGNLPQSIPEDQKFAVLYARSWAESNGKTEAELDDRLLEAYGEDGFDAIEIILHMIRMGNLLGNTWDFILYRISFGKWGV